MLKMIHIRQHLLVCQVQVCLWSMRNQPSWKPVSAKHWHLYQLHMVGRLLLTLESRYSSCNSVPTANYLKSSGSPLHSNSTGVSLNCWKLFIYTWYFAEKSIIIKLLVNSYFVAGNDWQHSWWSASGSQLFDMVGHSFLLEIHSLLGFQMAFTSGFSFT